MQSALLSVLNLRDITGGRKIQAIASALSRVDAVSGADDNYEQSRYA